jgi:lysosomal alpha-glucosidase
MHDAEFPYDVQWTDIDTMSSHLDFTYDNSSFNGLPDLVRGIQSGGQHYVNIIDPGISSTQPPGSYPAYDEGLKQGVFIKKFNSTEPIIGKVKSICRLYINIVYHTLVGLARSNSIS